MSARLALKHFGVEPDKDALLIQIGAEGTRMAALRAGSVSAIIVPVPAVAVLKRDGFNEVSFVGDAVEFASNGYTTTEQRIKEKPQEVKKVVRALYRGLRYAKENPDGTIAVIQSEWKVDEEIADGILSGDRQSAQRRRHHRRKAAQNPFRFDPPGREKHRRDPRREGCRLSLAA